MKTFRLGLCAMALISLISILSPRAAKAQEDGTIPIPRFELAQEDGTIPIPRFELAQEDGTIPIPRNIPA